MKRWYNYSRYKAEDRCRFCVHTAAFHLEINNFGLADQIARWDKCMCEVCPGFAPVDNLKYLEEASNE